MGRIHGHQARIGHGVVSIADGKGQIFHVLFDVAEGVAKCYMCICFLLHKCVENVANRDLPFSRWYKQTGICSIRCWFLLYRSAENATTLLLHVADLMPF